MRSIFITALVLVVFIAVGYLWYSQQPTGPADASALETTTLTRGRIVSSVTGAGNIYAPLQTNLSFQLTGVPITKINVKIGDKVKAGTVLAQVDDYDLQFALRTASASLLGAQARLTILTAAPKKYDVDAAKAQVVNARGNLDAAVAKYALVNDQITVAKNNLMKATVTLQNAQRAYDLVSGRADVGMLKESVALQQATIDYQNAQSAFNLALVGINDTAVKSTAQSVAQAEANLAKLLDPPDPEDIAVAQAAIDSAQTAVDLAKRKLDQAKIIAPFDGTVAAINYVVGQLALSGANVQPVITLVNLETLQTQLTFSEIDITKIKMNQEVTLTFDALGRRNLSGRILSISPIGVMTQGVVNYVVTVVLVNPDAAVLPGMTAEAAITTDQRDNVLRVASKAVKTQGRQSVITVVRDGRPITLGVRTGLSDDRRTEIMGATTLEGTPFALKDGDTVLMNPPLATPTPGRPPALPFSIK